MKSKLNIIFAIASTIAFCLPSYSDVPGSSDESFRIARPDASISDNNPAAPLPSTETLASNSNQTAVPPKKSSKSKKHKSVVGETAKAGVGLTDRSAKASVGLTDRAAKSSVGLTDRSAKASVGLTDRATKASVGLTDRAAKTTIGLPVKAVKGIFKAL